MIFYAPFLTHLLISFIQVCFINLFLIKLFIMIRNHFKTLLYGVLIFSSIQFAQCKSKAKDSNSGTMSSPVDSSMSTTTAPPVTPAQISPDEVLQTGLKDATKDYPDVKTSVNDGEVTLTGSITRDRLPNLMQSLNSLHPKKINNKLTIK